MKHLFPILIAYTFLTACSNEQQNKDTVVKKKTVVHQNPAVQDEDQSVGIIYDTIFAHSEGEIEWLTTRHKEVAKRTHLFTINNSRNYLKLYNEKAQFKVILDSLVEHCPSVIQNIKPKWQKFESQLRFDTLTPRFPKIEFQEEADYFVTRELVNSYNKMLAQEKQMKSNFEFSKRHYSLIIWKIKKGQKVKKGQMVGLTTN